MASALKNLSEYNPATVPSSASMTFGIIVSEYNTDITFSLRNACIDTLLQHGASENNISVHYVPGTFELPLGAKIVNDAVAPDALICLGCVIKGETDHDIYINTAVANGITNLSLQLGKPVIFGVLTPNNHQQAIDRAGGKHGNKGTECAVAAIKMVALLVKRQ